MYVFTSVPLHAMHVYLLWTKTKPMHLVVCSMEWYHTHECSTGIVDYHVHVNNCSHLHSQTTGEQITKEEEDLQKR
jgi:hypothetical protein